MSNVSTINHNRAGHASQFTGIYRVLAYGIQLPRSVKSLLLVVLDTLASVISLWLAIALRYGEFDFNVSRWVIIGLAVLPIILLCLIHFYSNVLRVFQDEIMRTVLLVMLGCLILGQLLWYQGLLPNVPRAAPVIHVFLLYIWLWNSRIILQFLLRRVLYRGVHQQDKQNVLIYGVGDIAKDLMHVLHQSQEYDIVGIVDQRHQLKGARILGAKVYTDDNLIELIDKLKVEHILFALPPEYKELQQQIIHQLADVSVKISQIPSLNDITSGKIKLSDIKPVDVMDVLQREAVAPNMDLLQKNIRDKVVMVTGAGGSIGSELCRQIIQQQPQELVLFEISEFALYAIHQELSQIIIKQALPITLHQHLGNVTNQDLVESLCQRYQVHTIYHAAAYKHVPIVECNEYEGIINNFVGTYRTVQAAINANVDTFVAISTDKAVRPTNVMGATKRMAELACQSFAMSQAHTTISMVRFGNVLGSSGSVVPLFNKQLAAGKVLTVTHPEVTRYFMTIPEAAQLVIQAGAMATGGEVFVLDMGEPVKIADLAKRMITLSGQKIKSERYPNGVEIQYVGLRPGEKLYEELIIDGDNIEPTTHKRIMQAKEHYFPQQEIQQFLEQVISQAIGQKDTHWLRQQFEYFVEGYQLRPKA
ncbi:MULTISPECIES: polysaccharide biosynthesis protein [unclassified Moraxella]|uniref:polysaccharide biosynthesis protein n=1 Tax=unclassified Moraxella TaxID=2685852 RepID=UPI003AF7E958